MTRPNIAIVGHDAARNALGRALVLADLLDPLGEVHLLAFGEKVWQPARGDRSVELLDAPRTTAGLPAAARRLRDALRNADLIVAVKPRVLSFGLSAAVREGRPLVLDIDDFESLFTRRRLGWLRQLIEPDREPITRLLERWRRPVAAVTVASRALQRRYGGVWVPHVRDRSTLSGDAARDGPSMRSQLGLDGAFVVGFVGTVRPHKGLDGLANSIGLLGGNARLLIAGELGGPRDLRGLARRSGGRLVTIDGPTLRTIGGMLGACDVVAIPQSRAREAIYQSPAKLLDALAAGAAIVTSDIGDAAELLAGAGRLVPPDDSVALARTLAELRDDEPQRIRLGETAIARASQAFGLTRWQAVVADVVGPLVTRVDPA